MFFDSLEAVLSLPTTTLKTNEKYLILSVRSRLGAKEEVIKIAISDNERLRTEYERLKSLKERYSIFTRSFPKLLSSGVFKKGILKERFYYVMERIDGNTLEDEICSTTKSKVFSNIFLELVEQCKYFDKSEETLKTSELLDYVRKDLIKIQKLNLLQVFARTDFVCINGVEFKNVLKDHDQFLLKVTKFIGQIKLINGAQLHNNYHGGNLIRCNKEKSLMIIDPDVSVEKCDTSFGIARYLYTKTHKKCEENVNGFHLTSVETNRETHAAVKSLHRQYGEPFEELHEIIDLIRNLNCKATEKRISFSLIQTLIRGISANYSEKIIINDSKWIYHGSMYLYFSLLIFCSNILETE